MSSLIRVRSYDRRAVHVKLAKYQRIKRKARRPEKFDHFARLYWRYHFKVYGPHVGWGGL